MIPAKERRLGGQSRTPWMKPLLDYETQIQEWDEEKEQICTGY